MFWQSRRRTTCNVKKDKGEAGGEGAVASFDTAAALKSLTDLFALGNESSGSLLTGTYQTGRDATHLGPRDSSTTC